MTCSAPSIDTGNKTVALRVRLAAVFYDLVLLFSLQFALTLFVILPMTHGEAVTSNNLYYQSLLLAIMYVYFVWQWCHGGQTLGMRAWKIRLVSNDGAAITWQSASIRWLAGVLSVVCFGLGFIWSLFSRDKATWHDRLSQSRLIRQEWATS